MDQPEVEVRRSSRRRRTVSAHRDGDKVVVLLPASLSKKAEAEWVRTMVDRIIKQEERRRPSDDQLMARARDLCDRYLGGIVHPDSVRWVDNQLTRWGSCTPADRTIRISSRLQGMPLWVLDYVLLHEVVHLIEPQHDEKFWGWVNRYPKADRAKGYLEGWTAATESEQTSEVD